MSGDAPLSFEEFSKLADQWADEVAAESDEQVARAVGHELPLFSNGMSPEVAAYFEQLQDPEFMKEEVSQMVSQMQAISELERRHLRK